MFKLVVATLLFANSTTTIPGACTTYSDLVSVAPTDWSMSVTIPKFDPSLGTLDTITFELYGHVEGDAFYESFESMDTDVSLTLSARIELTRPDLSTLIAVVPSFNVVEHPAGYDGMFDFDGDSGSFFNALSGDAYDFLVSPPPLSDLALFTGIGNIVLPVIATANSTGVGPGNWIFGFDTFAGAQADVTYCYTVPEPACLALLLPGLILAARRRRVVRKTIDAGSNTIGAI